MQRIKAFWAVLLAASALSCAPLASAPPAPEIPAPREPGIDRHALFAAALDCLMAPIVYDTPPWATNDDQVAAFGPDAMSCMTAARAIHVGSARLYRLDRDALFDLRHAIRRAAARADAPVDGMDMLALFDQSAAAVMEARRARTALAREVPHPSPEAVDKIRAREMLVKLDDFGRKRGGRLGAEARAVAMLVATTGFLQVARVRPLVRPFVAEPLFAVMFGSEFVSSSPDEPVASWSDYLAAAARAVPERAARTVVDPADRADSTRAAVGGGPVQDDRRALLTVTSAIESEMQSLASELPPGHLRVAVERTVHHLAIFDVDSALREP